MKSIKSFFKNNYIFILCFIVPMLIFIITLGITKYAPIGKNVITIYDGYHQYPGIAAYYSNVLKGTESLLYSFKGGLGTNFYALAVYYLFNPTALLLFLFNNNNLSLYYEIVIILKIGLCGLSVSFLLNYLRSNKTSTFLFSTAYALCAYNLMYFSNYMWIDSLILLPIVILSLHKLIYEKKRLMYLITLSITIISNFYMGYMICIFTLLYFIYKYFQIKKKDRRKGLLTDFILLSLSAGLISAFALLPVTLELFMGKNELYTSGFTKYFIFDFDFINMFYKLSPASSTNADISYGTLNIYCSVFTVINVIMSFFNSSFTKKEKIFNLIFIIYFILSFSFNLLDFSWQLFQKPIWYPVRYAYTFDLLLILIASKNFVHKDTINMSSLLKIIFEFILLILIFLGFLVINKFKFDFDNRTIPLLLSLIIITEYLFTIQSKSKIVNLFIICIVLLELTFNAIFTFKILSTSTTKDYERITINSYNTIQKEISDKDKSFYRMEFSKKHNYNNGYLFDYNGINFFSSIRNNNVIDFLDFYTDTKVIDRCSVTYSFSNPILNNLLGVKYLAGSSNAMYYNVAFHDNSNIYINNDAFSLGYMVNNKILETELEKNEYDKNYEKIVNDMIGYNNLDIINIKNKNLENAEIITTYDTPQYIPIISNENSYINYEAKERGFYVIPNNIYMYVEELKINGVNRELASSLSTFIYLDRNETLNLKIRLYNGEEVGKVSLSFIPYDKYMEFVNYIKANEINIINYNNDSNIEAEVTSTVEKNTLFTTIPYDEGWHIYVDNEEVKYSSSLNNAFITLSLNPGKHNIVFKYEPRGLKIGIYISTSALILSLSYIFIKRKKHI